MSGVSVIGAIVIGLVAGWTAERLLNRERGLVTNLLVGLAGSLLGGWLASRFGVAYGGWTGDLLASLIGAVLLLFVLGLFRRPAR